MSPFSNPCPHLKEVEGFFLCSIYETRPEQCVKHVFHARVCPIGLSVLGIDDAEQYRQRIDKGYELTHPNEVDNLPNKKERN